MTTMLQLTEPHCIRKLEFGQLSVLALATCNWVVFYIPNRARNRYELIPPNGLIHLVIFRRFFDELVDTMRDLKHDATEVAPVPVHLFLPMRKTA